MSKEELKMKLAALFASLVFAAVADLAPAGLLELVAESAAVAFFIAAWVY